MTFKELMKLRYPEKSDEKDFPEWGCPSRYFDDPPTAGLLCPKYPPDCGEDCEYCWNREVPEDTLNKVKAELGIVSPSEPFRNLKGIDEMHEVPCDMQFVTTKKPQHGIKYQEKCSTLGDVRALYERVIKNPNIELYRGYTEKYSYGWDPDEEDYIQEEGEYWFENPGFESNNTLAEAIREVGTTADKAAKAIASLEEAVAVNAGPRILDSGNRRQFETGAVRDICEGKGRCDLLPLEVVSHALNNPTFSYIYLFTDSGERNHLYNALSSCGIFDDYHTLFLEVAKHFEEGCKKYGDNNWQKGIPTHCYIDSAVRHYLKYLRGDKDEPHDRAFCWNIMCCIWTCIHKPELNDYAPKEDAENEAYTELGK